MIPIMNSHGILKLIKHDHDYKTFFLIVERLRVDSSCRVFTDKEVQMRITKVGEWEIGGIDMGGDLNRLESTKMENFKDRMVT